MRFFPPTGLPHAEFDVFYRQYAPLLWGLIVRAHLPIAQSKTILINTLLIAWQQDPPASRPDTYLLSRILRVAYAEGLPISPEVRSAIRPLDSSSARRT